MTLTHENINMNYTGKFVGIRQAFGAAYAMRSEVAVTAQVPLLD